MNSGLLNERERRWHQVWHRAATSAVSKAKELNLARARPDEGREDIDALSEPEP